MPKFAQYPHHCAKVSVPTVPQLTKPQQFWRLTASALLFGANFVKHPRMVGATVQSSRYLVEQVLDSINWTEASSFLEFGPGTGCITNEIVKRMSHNARLVAIETNSDFVEYLTRSLHDPRFRLVHGSATEADKYLMRLSVVEVDYVISGIPLSLMTKAARARIFQITHSILKPKGAFIVYQYSAKILSELRSIFRVVHLKHTHGKVLPLRLFNCVK